MFRRTPGGHILKIESFRSQLNTAGSGMQYPFCTRRLNALRQNLKFPLCSITHIRWNRVERWGSHFAAVVSLSLGLCFICETVAYEVMRHVVQHCLFHVFGAIRGLTSRHRASCILGHAFHYSPKNALYISKIYFIICYLLDRASMI